MLHAVPAVLAKKRELVDVYQRHWNCHVSPGEALFAHRGAGEKLLEECRRDGLVPETSLHDKEVFVSKDSTPINRSSSEMTESGQRRVESSMSTSRGRRLN